MTYSYFSPDVLPAGFRITHGVNDVVFSQDGGRYIDLLSGSGTVFLGHANPAITRGVEQQLRLLWSAGAIPTPVREEAFAAVEAFFPASHRLAVLYSTGMEAAEFAIRFARQATRRPGVLGFAGAMHGKSMATARLGWPNALVSLPDFVTVPYLPEREEAEILDSVRAALQQRTVAAVFLEGLLGSRGGHIPSGTFVEQLRCLCADYGTLLVADEIFTGFYRTGTPFLHQALGIVPDIVLVGKAMGNGFPVSGVVVDRRYPIEGSMLPGSTYAGNPLAAGAVVATLAEMRRLDLPGMVQEVEGIILERLAPLREQGFGLRGKGALWVLELPLRVDVGRVMARIVRSGVLASQTARYIRLLPPATISSSNLADACTAISEACLSSAGTGQSPSASLR